MDQRTETFLITHEIFAIDKYCFPGQSGNNFFELSKWPDGIAKITFKIDNYKSTYYLVAVQDVD